MRVLAQHMFKVHLDPGEEVLEICHRHPFIMFTELARIVFLGFVIPAGLYFLFPQLEVLLLIWVAITFVRLVYIVYNWYHDALLVTNVSLIKVAWFGFFNRTSARLEYPMVEGLSYAIQGFRKTIFNYGDVNVGRSGGGADLQLKDAINPARVERLVLSYQQKHTAHHNLQDSETLKTLLTNMLRHHVKTQPAPDHQKKK